MNEFRTFKLMPIDGRKTLTNHHVNQFIVDGETISDLVSYTTRVASYNHNTNQISIYNCQSQATARHINAFLYFYGFDTMKIKDIQKLI